MKCKYCDTEMIEILIREGCKGDDIVEWCEKCGTIVCYYDAYNRGPDPDDWKKPLLHTHP